MAKRDFPTPELLRQLLDYEPVTGRLIWKPRPLEMFATKRAFLTWNKRFAGNEGFTAKDRLHGYRVGNVNYKLCMAHRVIWAIVHGEYPDSDVDHINGNRSDNRIVNLRAATRSQNNCNSGLRSDNTSGYRGVSFQAQYGKWEARIHADKKKHRLGYFDTAEEAAEAYRKASLNLHGEFSRLV